MAYYQIGKEPDNLKRRLKSLFEKLDSAYPDKNIVGLHTKHKKWGETVTKLYRELGYPSGNKFLEAYGYTYGNEKSKSGRPKTIDLKAVIKELQKKYPNGSPFCSADELFVGTEYESKLKTIKNKANAEFGMPLGKYLLSIGLIQPKGASSSERKKGRQHGKALKSNKDDAPAKNHGQKKTKSSSTADPSDRIQLSEDGKTVTGFKAKSRRDQRERLIIRIPSGVETIEDNAFQGIGIDTLFIPKELKSIGKYTLRDINLSPYLARGEMYPKYIESIIVEEGNENYCVDEIGFYSIHDGKKSLELILDKGITEYVCPEDVNFLPPRCFGYCSSLKLLTLSSSVEEFDERCLSGGTLVKDVYIPKTVKKIYVEGIRTAYQECSTIMYEIDEESEYLFKDEDSIYEVLDDGTYKLVENQYDGKGRVLIMEGTSVIGEHAFEGCQNFTDIEFPKSLRKIEYRAFTSTALKSVEIPNSVKKIEPYAFSFCHELESVQLPSCIEYVAENAFKGCSKLQEIKSEGEKQAFLLVEGNVVRLISATGEEINRDIFDEFGKRIVREREEKYGTSNCISYDESKRVITVTIPFSQYTGENNKLLKERVACAEKLKVGSPVNIKSNREIWEVTSIDGKSLGTIGIILEEVQSYKKYISVSQGRVVEITPKSKRRANAKYAIGTIRFEIREKNIAKKDS